jgi:hypothetical protein
MIRIRVTVEYDMTVDETKYTRGADMEGDAIAGRLQALWGDDASQLFQDDPVDGERVSIKFLGWA